jgi:hypothetical protein
MRRHLKAVLALVVLAVAAGCAPPPPSADAIELVDLVWSRYPSFRTKLLAQEHRFEDLPRGTSSYSPYSLDLRSAQGNEWVVLTWDRSVLGNSRNVHNRWIAVSQVADAGALALSILKWGPSAKPSGWPASAPAVHECIAHKVVIDLGVGKMSDAIEFCTSQQRAQAWAAITS